MSEFTKTFLDRDRSRIDIIGAEESIEERSIELLKQLKDGKISISDLMGPLFGVPNLTPSINLPPGDKSYFPAGKEADFLPKDESNILLEEHVHPHDYINPICDEPYDLVAIGAGVSGLISVIVGAWLGKKCALIERHGMGGDCLNSGCVPSKAIIACAKALHSTKNLSQYGITIDGTVSIDFSFVMKRMREIRAKISHHDSVQRYSRDFCKHVYVGNATFLGGNEIEVTGDDGSKRTLKFIKAMICTGASAAIPPVVGLREIPHLTNGNFFNLQELPPRMLVIGCGPIGLELSQTLARFGSSVTCFEMGPRLLPREDPDASNILRKQLEDDGVKILLNVKILKVEYTGGDDIKYCKSWDLYKVSVEINGETVEYEGEALLNATGRAPNVYGIGLEKVGVNWDNRNGVHINEYFQTANPDIYAIGDCATPYKFTHSADFQARIAVRNMFLGDKNKLSDLLIPWCTYTEPEIAHVGKYEHELEAAGIEFESFTKQLADIDRCMCEGVKDGFIKITIKSGTDEILGATICGPNAGDMISEITLAMQYGLGIAHLAGTIHPYPTTQEGIRLACLGYNKYYKNPAAVPLTTLRLLMNEKK